MIPQDEGNERAKQPAAPIAGNDLKPTEAAGVAAKPAAGAAATAATSATSAAASAEAARRRMGQAMLTLVVLMLMVAVNALANILPFNGLSTGAVSDLYPNLFVPAGITFAIWGLIYILLALFVLFQFATPASAEAASRLKLVRIFFIISSLANAAWIFCWHYHQLPISLIMMLVILVSLIVISNRLAGATLPVKEWFFVRLPFSVYFGWITVASVANVTAFLVDLGWNRFGLSESTWTILIMIVATLIALAVISRNRDWAYGAVIVWAYCGILIKHLDPVKGFGGKYMMVMIVVSICLGFAAATTLLALVGRRIKLMPYETKSQKNHAAD